MDEQVLVLFRELADLPPTERENFFARRKVRPELRAEVESLLAFDHSDDHAVTYCIGREAAAAVGAQSARAMSFCGPYRLVRLLGSGGMGAVYLAERNDGEIKQQVAIKMLRVDAHRPQWQERFLRERQLLAYLNHPSVARLLDAGRAVQGQPYLVMEYVDGAPIDAVAAGISLREQLTLFMKVCEGVAHAHRRLIIHRDLKPSNILVDSSGQPKLLDFGIAKLLDETQDQTQTIERLLTPSYASPEQIRGGVQTTATDVYSLGAVLYKMLTGRSPHESGTGELKAIEIVAGTRPITAPRRLKPALPADLECILQKALRIEPEDRYASVEAFANDMRAFLDSKPVAARSANAWYPMRKFLRRHWLPAAAVVAVIASLSAGLYLANRERAIAQRRFQDVRQIANRLFDIDSTVSLLPGSTKARQMIVDTSLEYLRRLRGDVQRDPDLALEIANAYRSVAEVEGVTNGPNLGQVDNAARDLAVANGIIQPVLRSQPGNRMALLRAAQIAAEQAIVAWQGGRNDDAFPFARQSAAWLENFHAGAADKAMAVDILDTYGWVAHHYMIADRLDEALRMSKRGNELAVLLGVDRARARFLDTQALVLRYQGDLDGALRAMQECVRLHEPVRDAADYRLKLGLSIALAKEGWILGGGDIAISLERTEEAIQVLDRSFQLADELVHKDVWDESARTRLYLAGGALGATLRHSDPRRALAVLDHTYRDMSEIHSRLLEIRKVDLLAGAADTLRTLSRPAEARKRLDEAFALLAELKLYPADKIEPGSEAGRALRALAEYEASSGNLARGVEIYEDLLQRLYAGGAKPETNLQDAVTLSGIWSSLAALHRRSGHADHASTLETRRVDLWRQWERKLPNNPFVLRQLSEKVAS
jgi:predicted Ser/Thr protein kinase/tetratricopeptide (TPR) repeat protein